MPEWTTVSSFAPNFSLLRRVRAAKTDLIGPLMKVAGLDPKKDFRHSDLRGINWAGVRLSEFDLTGSIVDLDGNPHFEVGDYVFYPRHGAARIIEIQEAVIAGTRMALYVLRFHRERMTLRVPIQKVAEVGLRKLPSEEAVHITIDILKARPSNRLSAQSVREAKHRSKVESGDMALLAEVVRDLHPSNGGRIRSGAEQVLFREAFQTLVSAFALANTISEENAQDQIDELVWSARIRRSRK